MTGKDAMPMSDLKAVTYHMLAAYDDYRVIVESPVFTKAIMAAV